MFNAVCFKLYFYIVILKGKTFLKSKSLQYKKYEEKLNGEIVA